MLARWMTLIVSLGTLLATAYAPASDAGATSADDQTMLVTGEPNGSPGNGHFREHEARLYTESQLALSEGTGSRRDAASRIDSLSFAANAAAAEQVDARWQGTGTVGNGCNAEAYAVARDAAGRVYVGGRFTQCGNVAARSVAVFDPATQAWASLGSGSGNGVNGDVYAIATDGDDVYIAGIFTQAGGAAANNVARYNAVAQTWTPLGIGASNGVIGNGFPGEVYAITIANGAVYVGGQFTTANGTTANNVARFDFLSQTWSSIGAGSANGVTGIVRALAVSGSKVYVGGSFTLAGGVAANRVARFDTASQTWTALGNGAANGVDSTVKALVIAGDVIFVGGSFGNAGGVTARSVAQFNTASRGWAPLGSGATNGVNGSVAAFAVADGNIYVGGQFLQAGGAAAHNVARYDTTTQTWTPLGNGAANGVAGEVRSVDAGGGDVYVGGNFTLARGAPANYAARFGVATQSWSPLGSSSATGINAAVGAVAAAGSDLYVGGTFTQAGAEQANNIARFDASTQRWFALGNGATNGVNGRVNAVALSGDNLFVGGVFSQAGGIAVNNVARFNITTQTWAPLASGAFNGVSGSVISLTIAGNDVYVGGEFTSAGNVAANRVARFNNVTETWHSLGTGTENGVDGPVWAIAVDENAVYVGGFFSQAGATSANKLARFSTASQSWAALFNGIQNGVNGIVYALVVDGSNLFVGGSFFAQAGGTLAAGVVRIDTATDAWLPLGNTPVSDVTGTIHAISVAGGNVFVGGTFSPAGEATANRVARYSMTLQRWFPMGNGIRFNTVQDLALDSGVLAAGGAFGVAGATATSNVARYRIGAATTVTLALSSPASSHRPNHASPLGSSSLTGPSGIVRVLLSSGESCSITAPSGSCSITFATGGTRVATAVYDGDAMYEANASADLTVSAAPGSTVVFAASVINPDSIFASGFEQP